ncbi:PREDICTED: uncharacterized protein LOC103330952 isoform X2 [Prunus mume]|uniref:Uncharacterized protein LOC103330952 isoform X2 n=1 Tax=Prunus mume TaxID=102107 RepID=A0ABM0NYN2_PRUMU|nr:PREDICTED: uncharacterized protein LOC103330952 isoform X2 [Prunus mume]
MHCKGFNWNFKLLILMDFLPSCSILCIIALEFETQVVFHQEFIKGLGEDLNREGLKKMPLRVAKGKEQGEKVGKKRSTVVMADGSQVEELDALRDNDHLFIF